jgi:hypothetical protein
MSMLAEILWDQNSIAVVGVFSVPVVSIIATFYYKIERVRSENELKRSMVERGMSADEIVRVMAAQSHK